MPQPVSLPRHPTSTPHICLVFSTPRALQLFAEEVVRGGPAFAVSLALSAAEPHFRRAAELGAWQVISPAAVVGKLEVVADLHSIQEKVGGHWRREVAVLGWCQTLVISADGDSMLSARAPNVSWTHQPGRATAFRRQFTWSAISLLCLHMFPCADVP
jgi:hypothetical protein